MAGLRILKSDGRKFDVRTTTIFDNGKAVIVKRANEIRPIQGKTGVSVLKSPAFNKLQEKYASNKTV